MKYLAYFQAYTNTYGSTERLKRLYEKALDTDGVVDSDRHASRLHARRAA